MPIARGVAVEEKLRRFPAVVREDLRQEFALERARAAAEHRNPRPFDWVAADFFRRLLGRGSGRRSVPVPPGLAAPPVRYAGLEERRLAIVERAMVIAMGLPPEQRVPLLLALRCLGPGRAVDRVRAWLLAHPGRRATHRAIADDCGLSRESVTRALACLRAPGPARRRRTP